METIHKRMIILSIFLQYKVKQSFNTLKVLWELFCLWTTVAPLSINITWKLLCSCTLHLLLMLGQEHAVSLPLSAKQSMNWGILSLIWLKYSVKTQTSISAFFPLLKKYKIKSHKLYWIMHHLSCSKFQNG